MIEIIGPEGKKFLPVVGTVGLFIFFCNLLGLIPGLMSPTSKLNVTVGCALTVFVYYHCPGHEGPGLFQVPQALHGPHPGHRPADAPHRAHQPLLPAGLAQSIRLFSNIFAEEVLIVVIASIIPIFLPLPFMALSIFTAFLQAFVFVLLSCIYIAGAVEHDEEHH